MATLTKPRIISLGILTLSLEEEVSHTLSYLRAYTFLASLVPAWESLLEDWYGLFNQERELLQAVNDAEALIVAVDDDLDALAYMLTNLILAEVGSNRKSPRFTRYFKEATSRLVRPILSDQLATMREWVPSLVDAQSSAPVKDAGHKLATIVTRADDAIAALAQAKQRLTDFYLFGNHKAYVDRLNAQRQSLFGFLAELPHTQPAVSVPANFAHRFFLRDSSDRKPATIPELEVSILKLKTKVAKLEEELQKRVQAEEEEARLAEEADVKAALKTIADAEKARAEAEQRIEEARTRLAKQQKSEDK